jgi:hypothetical protein
MSANDFLAQSTPQSIGATSIPSSESFDNQSLLASTKLSLVPINTRESFPINSRIANIVFVYPDAIISSESIPTDLQLNVFNTRAYFEFTSSIASEETFLTPSINSVTNLSPNAIGSTESFVSPTVNFLTNITIGSGISSSESLLDNNLLKHVERLLYPHIITTEESFSSPNLYLERTLYPGPIDSSNFITNNHLINGIQPTIRFVQQYSINSSENFSSNNIFSISPPPPTIIASGFIKSWIAVVNSMIVNVTKKNILDVDTLIEYQRIIQPQTRYIIDSYIKSNIFKINYHQKYTAISYIDVEEIDMARQTSNNLESYIKQKYHIESYFVSENIQMPKITRFKIEKY